MKRAMAWVMAAAVLGGAAYVRAQSAAAPAAQSATVPAQAAGDLTGNWQGTLEVGQGARVLIKMTKDGAAYKGTLYVIDGNGQFGVPAIVAHGSDVSFAIAQMGANFAGTLNPDGRTIAGNLKLADGSSHALNLTHVSNDDAWAIPEPPKQLPADADPSFAVATIKPNPSGGPSMQGLNTNGHDFRVRNGSLGDLISFAYDVQMKQIVDGPSWMDQDRYDIDAKQEEDGLASAAQLRGMVRKLLEDRYQIKVHQEKRDLSAFVLTMGKNGQKLTPSQMKGPLPGMGVRPAPGGLTLVVNNGTLDDLAEFLQSFVLDRPVVNQTGISGRFDIGVTFTPDDSQFKGHPPKVPDGDTTEAAPSLFDAMDKQIGLKLSAEKAQVNVIVVDHVDHPSAN
jgi:uncharacterized protein (TIGR03435 family)